MPTINKLFPRIANGIYVLRSEVSLLIVAFCVYFCMTAGYLDTKKELFNGLTALQFVPVQFQNPYIFTSTSYIHVYRCHL